MSIKIKKYIKEIFLFFVMMTVFANAISLYRSLDLNKQPLNLSTQKLLDNQEINIDNTKPILIHFWATWCPTCKVEAANIQTISENFQVLTIAVKSGNNEEIQSYLDEHNLSYKVINDKDSSLAQSYKISVFPTTIIYNKDKEVVFSDVGYTSTLGLWIRMLLTSL